jgi:hypothetical protein
VLTSIALPIVRHNTRFRDEVTVHTRELGLLITSVHGSRTVDFCGKLLRVEYSLSNHDCEEQAGRVEGVDTKRRVIESFCTAHKQCRVCVEC